MKRFLLVLPVAVAALYFLPPRVATQPPQQPQPVIAAAPTPANTLDVRLPLKANSLRFAVIGDNGTGAHEEYDIAQLMTRYWQTVHFDFVVMNGDNIYNGHKPDDFKRKFEEPYQSMLDGGVKFYASLGNHDDPEIERNYKLFNMGGERYYSYKKGPVEFFALDSNYMDPTQLAWVTDQLHNSTAKWKIVYFHHPLFDDAKYHGPDLDLRARLMPIFIATGVNLVLSGHEHVYERIKPQQGIYFFIVGNSGELRYHNLRPGPSMAAGFDTDRSFMLMEIDGDTLYFQTIARSGQTVDSGSFVRQNSSK